MGSPSYMAPEQIMANPPDPRTDLYALGCTLYAMVTGDPPFTAAGPLSIVQQHITMPPQPLRGHRPEIPPQVEALVTDLLAKCPDERPSAAVAVRERIATAAADPALASTPSALRRSVVAPSVPAALSMDRKPPITGSGTLTTKRQLWAIAVAALVIAGGIMTALLTLSPAPQSGAAHWTVPSAAANGSPAAGSPSAPAASPTTASPSPAAGSRSARAASPPALGPATGAATPPTPPPSPTDPITVLRQTIQLQVTTGSLKADAANDLNHMVDDLGKSIATANTDDETHKLKALRDKLTALKNEGKLSADGYRVLSDATDQVAATLG
jgi:serine/threonine-protein kinase